MSQLPQHRLQVARALRHCAEHRLRAASVEQQLDKTNDPEERKCLAARLRVIDQQLAGAKEELNKLKGED